MFQASLSTTSSKNKTSLVRTSKFTRKPSIPPNLDLQKTKASKKLSPIVSTDLSEQLSSIIQLMRRPTGAAMAELMTLSVWQHHSIREVISNSLSKELKLVVNRVKSDKGETCYRISTAPASVGSEQT